MVLFPDNRTIQLFCAMTLYNLQDHRRAMELLPQRQLGMVREFMQVGHRWNACFSGRRKHRVVDGAGYAARHSG